MFLYRLIVLGSCRFFPLKSITIGINNQEEKKKAGLTFVFLLYLYMTCCVALGLQNSSTER